MKETASERIIKVLSESDHSLAIHEFGLLGISQTAISARLRELAAMGKVVGEYREGSRVKYWRLADVKPEEELVYNLERWV